MKSMKSNKTNTRKPNIYTAAARKLSRKPLSVVELRTYLLDKDYGEEEIHKVIKEYLDVGYLNDTFYASQFWKYGEGKGWADSRIKRELAKRGVDQKDIDDGYALWMEEQEEALKGDEGRALEIARKMTRDAVLDDYGHLDKTLKNRIGRRLYGYGYSSTMIFGTIDKIEREIKENSEE